MQPVDNREAGLDGLLMILREISRAYFVSPGDDAPIDWKFTLRRIDETGAIAEERSQHGGLSSAVSAEQGNFFAACNGGAEVLNHGKVVVRLRQPLDLQRMAPRRTFVLKPDIGTLDGRPCKFGGVQPLHLFLARGGLRGPGSGGEPGDEIVQLRNLFFALG